LLRFLPAVRTAVSLILVSLLVGACNSGGFFGTLPAHFRVFNALVDGGPVTLMVYTEPIFTNVPFEGITTYRNVDAGRREVRVIVGGTSTVYDQTTLIVDAASYTYVVYGTSAAPQVQLLVDAQVQDLAPDAGVFQLRVTNNAYNTANFDVYVTAPGASIDNISPNLSGVAYGVAASRATITAGIQQIRFTAPNSKSVIYDAGAVTFKERTVYQLVAYTRGSSTLLNAALLVVDTAGTGSLVNSLIAQWKVVNAAPATAMIDAFVNGNVAFANVPYQNASGYESLAAGKQTVTVEAVTSPGAVIASVQPPFASATDTSVVVTGLPGAQTAIALNDNNIPGALGNARVRFVNVAPGVGPVDVLVNFAKQVSSLATNAASGYVETAEDTYTLTFDVAGTTTEILSVPGVLLSAGHTYTVYLVGTAGQYSTILTRDD
jgi:hypothetical protein